MKPSVRRLARFASALPALGLVLSLLLSESPAVIFLSLVAIFFHEAGHLFFFALCGLPLPTLAPSGAGMRLLPRQPLTPFEEGLIALGGPLFSLLAALPLLSFGSAFGSLAGGIHLLYGLFNLIPFASTDGERLLRLFLVLLFPTKGKKAVFFLSRFCLALLFFFSLFLFYLTGYGLCGLFFSLFCYFQPYGEEKTFFEISREKKRF